MTDAVKGLSPDEVDGLAAKFRELAKSGIGENISKKLEILGGVHQFPQRVKCAVLPWETLVTAMENPIVQD
jgi:nitrogen fixation NifU-like protein